MENQIEQPFTVKSSVRINEEVITTNFKSTAISIGKNSESKTSGIWSIQQSYGGDSAAISNANHSVSITMEELSEARTEGKACIAVSMDKFSDAVCMNQMSVAITRGRKSIQRVYRERSLAIGFGIDNEVSGSVGSFIGCAEYKDNGEGTMILCDFKVVYVDGVKIKAHTCYKLIDGEFVES